jgi:hypothetical protein
MEPSARVEIATATVKTRARNNQDSKFGRLTLPTPNNEKNRQARNRGSDDAVRWL